MMKCNIQLVSQFLKTIYIFPNEELEILIYNIYSICDYLKFYIECSLNQNDCLETYPVDLKKYLIRGMKSGLTCLEQKVQNSLSLSIIFISRLSPIIFLIKRSSCLYTFGIFEKNINTRFTITTSQSIQLETNEFFSIKEILRNPFHRILENSVNK